MNVDIELFPLPNPNGVRFDIRKFFIDIVSIDPDDLHEGTLDSEARIMELSKRIR